MMKIILCLCLFILTAKGHSNKLQDDADLQSELMPQELNPEFISGKDQPWKAIMPILRSRRDLSPEGVSHVSITGTLKRYSRIIACVVLVMSAIVEIVLYVLDTYIG